MLPAGAKLLAQGRFGKLLRESTTEGKSRLVPDARKGVLRAIRTEDGLMHLMWSERAEGGGAKDEAEDDVIVFPEEATFSQIPGQRAATLKFEHEADRNAFFWIQEPAEGGDAALVTRINTVINTPMGADDDQPMEDMGPIAGSAAPATDALLRSALATGPGAGLTVPAGPMVGEMPQGPGQDPRLADQSPAAQLAAMLSGIASGAPATSAGAGAGAADAGASLQAALMAALARQQHGRLAGATGPSLADVLRPEAVAPLLADPEVLERLGQFLPEQHRSVSELRQLARSAQFQQQLGAFSAALQTGQLDLSQFGLRAEGFSVTDFMNALDELVRRERQQQGGQQ